MLKNLTLLGTVSHVAFKRNEPDDYKLAGNGKSYIIRLIVEFLKTKNANYLLMVPAGVAAQNINGKPIHSKLRASESPAFMSKLISKIFKGYYNEEPMVVTQVLTF